MSKANTDSATTDVYQAHRDKILGNNVIIPDGYKHPQGYYTDQIKDYAHTKISEDDASRIRCGTFKHLDNLCKYIAVKEDVPVSKVYPALMQIGYNIRYHNLKCNDPDPLYQLGILVKEAIITTRTSIIEYATENDKIFGSLKSVQYRMHRDVIAISMKDAEYCGIKVSELNMYNVLTGINTLILNEPDYDKLKDNRIVVLPMGTFNDIKDKISFTYAGFKAILSNK